MAPAFGSTSYPSPRNTTLCTHAPGDGLNLEVDLIARYLERMLGVDNASDGGMTRARLESIVSGGGGEK